MAALSAGESRVGKDWSFRHGEFSAHQNPAEPHHRPGVQPAVGQQLVPQCLHPVWRGSGVRGLQIGVHRHLAVGHAPAFE